MADYYGTGRTNYFKVKDEEAFRKMASQFEVVVCERGDGKFAVISEKEDGCFSISDDDGDDVCMTKEIVEHLAEGEVAVFIHIGSEKARYLDGVATAVHSSGQVVQVHLDDIYEKAMNAFKVTNIGPATY